jgi:hypothetical protein
MTESFRAAVHAVVDGDEGTLRTLLDERPALVAERGAAPFQATLLHYVAANGVEDEFQRTPENAPAIGAILLESGAEPDAVATAYGRSVTPLEMLVSSRPPFERGVQEALVRVLVGGGAEPDGPSGGGIPLTTALVFGYTGAAETLVQLGARHDNLFAAAGLGKLGQVQRWFGSDGRLQAGSLRGYEAIRPEEQSQDAASILQEAFHFAVTHGRAEVAEFLLERGADPNGRVRGHHCELPLIQALFVHSTNVVSWLLNVGADPELIDNKRGITAIEHVRRFGPARARVLLGLE